MSNANKRMLMYNTKCLIISTLESVTYVCIIRTLATTKYDNVFKRRSN
jgi:hypothetical protein